MISKLSVLFVIVGVAGMAQGKTYQGSGFRLEFDPTKWVVADSPTPAKTDEDQAVVDKTLLNLQHRIVRDEYRARFSVVLDNLSNVPKKASLADQLLAYRNHAVEFMKSQRFDVVRAEAIQLPKVKNPGIEIVAYQRDFGLTFRQVVFIQGGKAYLLTGAARTKSFDLLAPELDGIFKSFSFEAKN